MRDTGFGQLGFRLPVFYAQSQRGRVRTQDAGVRQQPHTGLFRRGNNMGVLGDALTDFIRRNQKHLIGSAKSCVQRVRLGIIGLAHADPLPGKVFHRGRVAHHGHQFGCGYGFQELIDHQPAQIPGCTCNHDHG